MEPAGGTPQARASVGEPPSSREGQGRGRVGTQRSFKAPHIRRCGRHTINTTCSRVLVNGLVVKYGKRLFQSE